MKPHTESRTSRALAARTALLLGVLLAGTAPADSSTPKFTMNVIKDAPFGADILDGDYADAIDGIDLERRGKVQRFFAANNLCVALVKAGKLVAAADACDLAVDTIRGTLDVRSRGLQRIDAEAVYRRYLAIGLSNRGVMRAVAGDSQGARDDFAAALDLGVSMPSAKINIARLDDTAAGGA